MATKKYIAICIPGLESVAIEEVKELIKANSKILIPGRLIIESTEKDITNLIYNTRSLIYIYELLVQNKIRKLEEIKTISKGIDFKKILKDSFMVKCERSGTHNFKSIEIERELGAFIHESTSVAVDLQNPATTIFVDIEGNFCAVGIDLTGQKLSKRDYRIKLTSQPINPCIAYSLIKLSNWNTKEILLDAFTKSGEIPIEAALLAANISPQKHIKSKLLFTKIYNYKLKDKGKSPKLKIYAADEIMAHIRNAETNAKLAGVNKLIRFTRLETSWLDSKFKKNSIDKIISFPPQLSHLHPVTYLEERYKDFFYNGKYILKKKGTITLLIAGSLELVTRFSNEYKFSTFNVLQFNYANQNYTIVQLKK